MIVFIIAWKVSITYCHSCSIETNIICIKVWDIAKHYFNTCIFFFFNLQNAFVTSREVIITPVLCVRKLSLKRLDDLPMATQEDSLASIPGLQIHNAMFFRIGTSPSPSLKAIWKASGCCRQNFIAKIYLTAS